MVKVAAEPMVPLGPHELSALAAATPRSPAAGRSGGSGVSQGARDGEANGGVPAKGTAGSRRSGRKTSAAGAPASAATSSKRPRVATGNGGASSGKGSADGPVSDLGHVNSIPEVAKYFEVGEAIGSGAFSTVFRARVRRSGKEVALKCIVQSSHPKRIEREIFCLQQLAGRNHVAGLRSIINHGDTVVLVLDYFPHRPFKEYSKEMSVEQLRTYMRGLMSVLQYCVRVA